MGPLNIFICLFLHILSNIINVFIIVYKAIKPRQLMVVLYCVFTEACIAYFTLTNLYVAVWAHVPECAVHVDSWTWRCLDINFIMILQFKTNLGWTLIGSLLWGISELLSDAYLLLLFPGILHIRDLTMTLSKAFWIHIIYIQFNKTMVILKHKHEVIIFI